MHLPIRSLVLLAGVASVLAAAAIIAQPLFVASAASYGINNTETTTSAQELSDFGPTMVAQETPDNGTKIVLQGTASSPGDEAGPFQVIDILTPREDGKIYVGWLTFISTKPIFVAPWQTFGVGNETLDPSFGDLLVAPLAANGTLVAPAIMTPEYSQQIMSQIPLPEIYSASVPFAGSGLSVGNLNGEPFLISYTLYADLHTPLIADSVDSAIVDEVQINGTRVSIVSGAAFLNDTAYDPNPVTVSAGTIVTWVNDDLDPHTVTSGNITAQNAGQLFDSGYMGLHRTFSHTFNEPGEYDYFCMLHPNMVGTVVVEE